MTYCSNCGTKLAAETRFCQACGTAVAKVEISPADPLVFQPRQPDQPQRTKPKGKLVLILSLLGLGLILLGAAIFFLLQAWPGAKSSQEEAKWQAVWIEMPGLKQPVADIFPDGLTLELKQGGKFILTLEGEQASGRWQLKGEDLSLRANSFKTSGKITDAEMILDDLFGYRFVFYQEDSAIPKSSESQAGSTAGIDSLPQGSFSTETKTISAAGVTLTYPVTANAAENIFGLPSIELPAGYWLNASVETAFDGPEHKMKSLEAFTDYKDGRVFSTRFQDLPCVVLMHDTDKANSADAAINIFIYINDEQLVQISVISLGGDLAAMLADQDLWAVINSVTWQ